jgi:3-phenylpropionate/trans-cinnamate dioxygenase ferredoxin subunit
MSRRIKWHRVDSEFRIPDSGLLEYHVDDKAICVAMHDGKPLAFSAKCPHASGRFVDGWCDPLGNVVCPLHRYKFNMTTGRNVSGEGYHLKTYPVEHREDGLYIGMEEGGLGWFR